MIERRCIACGERLPPGSHAGRKFCPEICDHRRRPAPAIYRFISPDGRCYVGSASDVRMRNRGGLSRSNSWIAEVVEKHPLETWTFEVLEELLPGCSKEALRRAEQRHIERFRSWDRQHGFNMHPAVWFGETPGILAARERRAEQTRQMIRRITVMRRQREAVWRAGREPPPDHRT